METGTIKALSFSISAPQVMDSLQPSHFQVQGQIPFVVRYLDRVVRCGPRNMPMPRGFGLN